MILKEYNLYKGACNTPLQRRQYIYIPNTHPVIKSTKQNKNMINQSNNNSNKNSYNNSSRFHWKLEKYNGRGSRHECPGCHDKQSFVRYVYTDSGEYVGEQCGKCNHENRCGYHLPPKEYFTQYDIHQPQHISAFIPSWLRPEKTKYNSVPEQKPLCVLDPSEKARFYAKPSNFVYFLRHYFPYDDVQKVIELYHLGGDEYLNVAYPYIDIHGQLRTIKLMSYDAHTGHRTNVIYWLHSYLKKHSLLSADWQLSQCLFGEHLLSLQPKKPIHIVESEKTAVICSLQYPGFTWLATGSLGGFSEQKLSVLARRHVRCFPDLGAYDKWLAKASQFNLTEHLNLHIDSYLDSTADSTQRAMGLDLADFILRDIDKKHSEQ